MAGTPYLLDSNILRLLPDSLAVHEEWRKLLVTCGVSGVQATMHG